MSRSAAAATPPFAAPVPSGIASSEPGFFAHHGLMAPGIRLLRSIGFPAKATWVSFAFLLPLLLLGASLWKTAFEGIAFSEKEQLGVAYVQPLLPLLDAAQNRRRAATAKAADLDAAQQRVADALKGLAATHARIGGELGVDKAFQRAQQLQQELATRAVREDAVSTFAAHTQYVDALLALLQDVADQSNLTLDPEVTTYYLMDAVIFKQPQLTEMLGRMRGMGNAILRTGSATLAQRDQLVGPLSFAMAHHRALEQSLERAMASDPALARELDIKAANDAAAAFLQTVRTQLLGDAVTGDPAAYVAQGNEAIALQYAGMQRVLVAMNTRIDERVAGLKRTLAWQLGLAALGVSVAVYLLVAFYRVTQGGISELARQLDEIADGNLTHDPKPWGRDEVAQLMTTLSRTIVALRRTVHQVRGGAGEIHTASEEVASASMDLSRRTEDTAAQLQSTASALERIGRAVSSTADTAGGAARIVGRNADVAVRGGQVFQQVESTMADIRTSSGRIADIISTIDGIAFQTNILALNAAVEAARAGEQGRGFAVVASEVRALAQRCGSAAREIKTLIGTSVEQVQTGSAVVVEAGAAMGEIVRNAEQLRTLIGEISQAASQQAAGLAEVTASVEQLDGMAQQNAALVEETAAASASLKDNAERLSQEMAFFRVA